MCALCTWILLCFVETYCNVCGMDALESVCVCVWMFGCVYVYVCTQPPLDVLATLVTELIQSLGYRALYLLALEVSFRTCCCVVVFLQVGFCL